VLCVVGLAIRTEDEAERQLAGGAVGEEHTIGDDIPFEIKFRLLAPR
jgi:hypothetical protein